MYLLLGFKNGEFMKYKSLKGYYKLKDNAEINIVVERDYKARDTVDFFYFMCSKTGGGTISKDQLLVDYIKS
jgi:hypothetical protein